MKANIFKNNVLNRYVIPAILLVFAIYAATGCREYPVDEDGLLITEKEECYVSSFQLLGTDRQNVLTSSVALGSGIDSIECTIDATVRFGTDLKNLYPQFMLGADCKLEPKITGLTDFSDLTRQWTVVSGNRKIRKTYTVNISVQTP